MNGDIKIRERYLEEIRLYMWHSASAFSFCKKEKSKELAQKHLVAARMYYQEYIESTQQNLL